VDFNRCSLGLSRFWGETEKWLSNTPLVVPLVQQSQKTAFEPKWRNIPVLSNYKEDPGTNFWKNFPSAEIPRSTRTKVNRKALEGLVSKFSPGWPYHKKKRAEKLLNDLWNGGSAYQKEYLPPAAVPNAKTAYEHGQMLTDKIATWIEDKYVAGPFDQPPFPGFRSNTLMAIDRNDKIRPVINMSGPKDNSFNSNMDSLKIEKVKMSTAKTFGFSLRESGKNATLSKFDLKDAFKLIPARKNDWKLQGFKWLNKYFFETQMIFGAVPSVSNFDRLGNTLVELAKSHADLKNLQVHRTLDDIPIVSHEGSGFTEKLSDSVITICKEAGVPLADLCPNKEKAFLNEKKGIVLGIGFDSTKLEWFLPKAKADKTIIALSNAASCKYLSLIEVQKVMGQVNDLSQMCPFIKVFMASGYGFLGSFKDDKNIVKSPDSQTREDWLVCARMADSARKGLPLAKRPSDPPLGSIEFFSDAAGAKFDIINGERVPDNKPDDRGAGCLAYLNGKLLWFSSITWPKNFLETERDEKGAFFGSKMTTLECAAILLPLLGCPEKLVGRCLVFRTDNLALVYGFANRRVKKDNSASELIKAVYILTAYLGCRFWVQHVPRMSCEKASLADHLSRKSSLTSEDKYALVGIESCKISGCFLAWLRQPSRYANLALALLAELKRKVQID